MGIFPAKGNRIRSGSPADVQHPFNAVQLQKLREVASAPPADPIQHRQHVGAHFRIGFKHVPADRRHTGSDGLFQFPPIHPFRIVKNQQMPHVVGT